MSNKNYVEVMVAADYEMSKYHGDNLQHYILTLMSIVSMLYYYIIVCSHHMKNVSSRVVTR